PQMSVFVVRRDDQGDRGERRRVLDRRASIPPGVEVVPVPAHLHERVREGQNGGADEMGMREQEKRDPEEVRGKAKRWLATARRDRRARSSRYRSGCADRARTTCA